MNLLYDFTKTFEENKNEGPFFSEDIAKLQRIIPSQEQWYNFCDYKIASRIGVAACPLTATSRGVALCSRLGFDVITYKTIRSKAISAHAWPNVVYVDILGQLTKKDLNAPIQQSFLPSFAITNSIGNASDDLEISLPDIATSRSLLLPGQILIVSIYGTGNSQQELMQDFACLAKKAQEAGAHVIEANFSCPNIGKSDLYMDTESVYTIAHAITKVIAIPLLIKVGLFSDHTAMRTTLIAAARAGVCGITGINAVRMKVVNEHTQPVFGNARIYSGVSGNPIRALSLSFLRDVMTINLQEKLGLQFISVGGIMQPKHIKQFLDAGASVVQVATGAIFDPYLAMKYHQAKKEEV
jgi:dihydroorotate dehydrogenase